MRYWDPLYGEWELPEILARLARTREMQRLRGITQSDLPNFLLLRGPMPSRFQHGLGVAYLACLLFAHNRHLVDEYLPLLPAAALLHDAGSPPFSHLGEHFLREVTGKDGEEFLMDILDGSKTERILRDYDIFIEDVLDLVTGRKQPIAAVLNGSLDIDNLDNIARYHAAVGLGSAPYRPTLIALCFRHLASSDEWFLMDYCYPETKKWQEARAAVYSAIYAPEHLSVSRMVYRALEIAFTEGEIGRDFFFLDDAAGLAYLAERCNRRTAYLIRKAIAWEWYEEIVSIATDSPGPGLQCLASHWTGRRRLADLICAGARIAPQHVCVYAGKGKDRRDVTVRFIDAGGNCVKQCPYTAAVKPVYRLKIYAPYGLSRRTKMKIAEIAASAVE
ncbi:MAG: HD domain-containing protein [Patescibacteria group bacterium]